MEADDARRRSNEMEMTEIRVAVTVPRMRNLKDLAIVVVIFFVTMVLQNQYIRMGRVSTSLGLWAFEKKTIFTLENELRPNNPKMDLIRFIDLSLTK